MSAQRHQRVRDVFMKLIELEEDERAAELDRARADDIELRREIESLLAHDRGENDELLSTPLLSPEMLPRRLAEFILPSGELPSGTRVGRYTIISLLGAGGMGMVYSAAQDHPRRTVALKLIRHDPANPDLRRRIELEAELLGRLKHPGIASVYEAGYAPVTGAEVPYFAMELVEGAPLTAYARARKLDARACVEMLIRLCDAASHAHQRGVIHRDLKPGNILVSEEGEPKILDFGVARVVSLDGARGAGQTLPGQVVGTLGYMSPEQLDPDPQGSGAMAQSDVYALGVMLYELLSGQLPFDPKTRALSEFAALLKSSPAPALGKLNRACRGDLEIIASRALSADLERRYRSADELADDLRRYLERRPIAARRDSALYVIAQMARRHKAAASLTVALIAGVLVFGAVATTLALRNQRLAHNLQESLYASRIGQAQGSVQSSDMARARVLLRSLPESLRGWEWRHLMMRTDQSVRTVATPGNALDVAFSPDSSLMAVALDDRPTVVLNIADGSIVWSSTRSHTQVAFSHDGRRVAAKVHAGPFDILDAATGALLQSVDAPTEPPVAFGEPILRHAFLLPDDKTILGYRNFGLVYRWSEPGAQPEIVWNTRQRDAGLAAISHDGSIFAISTEHLELTPKLRLWSTADGSLLATLADKPGMSHAAFTPDGETLGIAFRSGDVGLWDWKRSGEMRRIGAHSVAASVVDISHDGRLMASGGRDGLLKIWGLPRGEELSTQVGNVYSIRSLAFSHDDKLIATAAEDPCVRLWSTHPPALVPSIKASEAAISCITPEPDGGGVVVGDRAGVVRAIAQNAGGEFESRVIGSLPAGACRSIVARPGEVIVGGERGAMHFFSAGVDGAEFVLPVFSVQPVFIVPAPDGSFLAVRGSNNKIAIVDPAKRAVVNTIEPGSARLASLAVSGKNTLAIGDRDGNLYFVTRDGQTAAPSLQLGDVAASLAFHTDGTKILIGGTERSWSVRRVDDGKILAAPADAGGAPRSIVFLDDASRVVSIGNDRSVRVWRWDSAEELCALVGHDAATTALSFDPASRSVISGDAEGVIRIWRGGVP